jgi:U3 small nucleolar RNA-associated protein 6
VAQRAGSRALAGRIAARAVQLHPRTPALYVIAAAHELAHGGMGAARVLLQRGLRLNAGSADMWREYVRLELGFVEAVRRRWDVLGISLDAAPSSTEGQGEEEDQGQDKGPGERVDRAEEDAMGDAARRAIMEGAIVRKAIDGAAKGMHAPNTYTTLAPFLGSAWFSSHGVPIFFKSCNSVADDRAVSEFADASCRIPGPKAPP